MANRELSFQKRSSDNRIAEFERTGRFFCKKGSWFFKTREAVDYGPYQNRVECRYAYNEFIEVVSDSAQLAEGTFDYQDVSSNWQPPKINFS